MKIYGLVGSSGTGKSYRAVSLANEKGISCIIDDGLLIKGARIIAGTSAKREATKLSAVRRAIFMDSEHSEKVREAILVENPSSVLILGTSISMIERISKELHLPDVEEIILIEDVASESDISWARKQRKEQGKHIIPVPTFQVRKDFSGFFIDPLRIFRIQGKGRQIETLEKTVVRPTFSYFGRFYIADSAIESIVSYSANLVPGVSRVQKCVIQSQENGISIDLDIEVFYGIPIHQIMKEVQEKVLVEVGYATDMNIIAVNVLTRKIVILRYE
ncbi:MAG: Asp23/Gls24 family envelope stress response protein [Clostridiales bacterium]|nr:Asp23/Gls24 family envelope stress response protein [Clostridiales bacterium]